jgi:opacity protein-like surface antigen
MKSTSILWIIIVVLIIALLISIHSCQSHKDKLSTSNNNIEALLDTVKIYQNKYNESISSIHIFESMKAKDMLTLHFKDSILISLQNKIKDYEQEKKKLESLVQFYSTTNYSATMPTTAVYDSITQSPIYSFNTVNDWIRFTGMASIDSTAFNLSIYNKYSVATIPTNKGFQIEITNHNPYTTTPIVTGWQQSYPKQKRFGLGVSVGYGYGFNKFSPYVGIGVNYNLFEW